MRVLLGVLTSLAVMPVWANGPWRVTQDTPTEVVAIDLSSLERSADRVSFRERRTLRGGQTDPHSLRPLGEVLSKRVVDCRARRIATLSRAVFSNDDALIDHQVARLQHANWEAIPMGDPLLILLCGGS